MRFTLLVVAILSGWIPSAYARSESFFPPYKATARNPEDDTAIRKAVAECWLSLDTKRYPTSNARELAFNSCVSERGIPLLYLLK